MPRFFSDASPVDGTLTLLGEDASHICKSLRMQAGDSLTVCNGAGTDYSCTVLCATPQAVTVRIAHTQLSAGEPNIAVTLFMALPKADKMELVIQKATELGVYDIVPVLTSRCVSRPEEKAMAKKIDRWNKIAAEAAKQCGRGRIPQVHEVHTFDKAVQRAAQAQLPLFCYEAEQTRHLHQILQTTAHTISVFVGAEGGFSPQEAQQAAQGGLHCVSLGTRILRCETAPLAALAVIMYQTNNL